SKDDLPDIKEGDLELISQPIDFYCQNIYQGIYVKSDGNGGYKVVPPKQNTVYSNMDLAVTPEALYWGPKFLYERYHVPFVISENGTAVTDIITKDKKIHDSPRIEYLKQYIEEYERAYKEGIDIRGYFVWSLLDNLEWYEGYRKRFGLVYVDYETFERIPKDSFYFYKDLISRK
ncbi:MAG: family 1 glycosylhydrolase, partial [Bacilli bacterium]|nr:family 1 glycosylhydrolase [Bacilli bacterium]